MKTGETIESAEECKSFLDRKVMEKNFSIYNRWGLPNKDLSDIRYSRDCNCPNCGEHYPEDCEDGYEVDGEKYPQMYNEVLYGDMDGTIHDWDEVHKCPKCKTLYQFKNGCF